MLGSNWPRGANSLLLQDRRGFIREAAAPKHPLVCISAMGVKERSGSTPHGCLGAPCVYQPAAAVLAQSNHQNVLWLAAPA